MNVRTLLIPLLCLGAVAFACGPKSHTEASLVAMSVSRPSAPAERPQQQARRPRREAGAPKITPAFAVQVEQKTIRFALDVTNDTK